jgi:peptidyl-prolyl cis-trans isomerase SurA
MLQRLTLVCFPLFLFLLLGFASQGAGKLVNRIVAVVNGEVITLHELKQRVNSDLPGQKTGVQQRNRGREDQVREKALQSMINDLLLEQEAERLELEVSDVEVEQQIKQIRQKRELSSRKFRELLQKNGLTMQEYKQRLREEIKKSRLLNSMVRQKVVVSEEEIKSYYRKHKDQFRSPKCYHLRLILMKDRKELERIRGRIAEGELAFAEAARKHSRGPGASEGGDLGMCPHKDLRSDWKQAVQDLQPGEMSAIFPLQGHHALLYVESLQPGGTTPLSKVRGKIRDKVYQKKLQARFKSYIDQLRGKAVVDVRL